MAASLSRFVTHLNSTVHLQVSVLQKRTYSCGEACTGKQNSTTYFNLKLEPSTGNIESAIALSRDRFGHRTLVGNLFKSKVVGPWAENADGQDDHQHAGGNERKNALRAEIFQKESDHEAGEHCGQAAPGINKPDGARADARGKKFGLIGMKGIGQKIVRERDHHSQADQPGSGRLAREEQPKSSRADSRCNDLPFALEAVGKKHEK